MVSVRSESEPRLKGRCQRRRLKVNLAGNNGRPLSGSRCFLFAARKEKFHEMARSTGNRLRLNAAKEILRRYNPWKTKRKWNAAAALPLYFKKDRFSCRADGKRESRDGKKATESSFVAEYSSDDVRITRQITRANKVTDRVPFV